METTSLLDCVILKKVFDGAYIEKKDRYFGQKHKYITNKRHNKCSGAIPGGYIYVHN